MEVIIIILLTLLLVAIGFAGWMLNDKTLRPKGLSYQEVRDGLIEAEFCTEEQLDSYDFTPVKIKSDYGYTLNGLWLCQQGATKTVIIVHGYTMNALASVRYADIFLTRGYNLLMYDHRFHGESVGDSCSMGYYESGDLKRCVDWVVEQVGEGSVIGLYGESMGASTSLIEASADERISFVVADCGYADLWEEMRFQIRTSTRLPSTLMLYIADLFNRIRTGHSYAEVSPIKSIENTTVPILFIHGDNDKVTPCEDSLSMHNKHKGKKQLFIVNGGNHADSIKLNKDRYFSEVHSFLDSLSL